MTQLIQKRSNLGHIQYLDRVLSTGGWAGGKLPPKTFPEKNLKLFQIKVFLMAILRNQ